MESFQYAIQYAIKFLLSMLRFGRT